MSEELKKILYGMCVLLIIIYAGVLYPVYLGVFMLCIAIIMFARFIGDTVNDIIKIYIRRL